MMKIFKVSFTLLFLLFTSSAIAAEGRLGLKEHRFNFTECSLFDVVERANILHCKKAIYAGDDHVAFQSITGEHEPAVLNSDHLGITLNHHQTEINLSPAIDINMLVVDFDKEPVGSEGFDRLEDKLEYDNKFLNADKFYTGYHLTKYAALRNLDKEGDTISTYIIEAYAPIQDLDITKLTSKTVIEGGHAHIYQEVLKYDFNTKELVYDFGGYLEFEKQSKGEGVGYHISPVYEGEEAMFSSKVYATKKINNVQGFVKNIAWHDALFFGMGKLAKAGFVFIFASIIKVNVKKQAKKEIVKQAAKQVGKQALKKLTFSKALLFSGVVGMTLIRSDNGEVKGVPTRFIVGDSEEKEEVVGKSDFPKKYTEALKAFKNSYEGDDVILIEVEKIIDVLTHQHILENLEQLKMLLRSCKKGGPLCILHKGKKSSEKEDQSESLAGSVDVLIYYDMMPPMKAFTEKKFKDTFIKSYDERVARMGGHIEGNEAIVRKTFEQDLNSDGGAIKYVAFLAKGLIHVHVFSGIDPTRKQKHAEILENFIEDYGYTLEQFIGAGFAHLNLAGEIVLAGYSESVIKRLGKIEFARQVKDELIDEGIMTEPEKLDKIQKLGREKLNEINKKFKAQREAILNAFKHFWKTIDSVK